MKKDDCIFCKIANGVIGSTTVYEDEDFRVILDLSPASPGHALILPKEARIGEAMKEALHCDGFNLVQNNGEAAGQTVKHFHMHVIPRYENSGKKIVTWDPGEATQEEREAQGDAIRRALK